MTIDDLIACAERELKMRRRVYPKWVAIRRMKQEEADHELAAMSAIIANLKAQRPDLLNRAETVEGHPV